jgi:hypothetical protein
MSDSKLRCPDCGGEVTPDVAIVHRYHACWDRVLMSGLYVLVVLAMAWQVAAVTLKLCSAISWRWWLVLLPAEVVGGAFFLACFFVGLNFILSFR